MKTQIRIDGRARELEKEESEERDRELKKVVGNLLIAEYQVAKLRDRLLDRIGDRFPYGAKQGPSSYKFKNYDKWGQDFN